MICGQGYQHDAEREPGIMSVEGIIIGRVYFLFILLLHKYNPLPEIQFLIAGKYDRCRLQ
jgi:hypothetical protein